MAIFKAKYQITTVKSPSKQLNTYNWERVIETNKFKLKKNDCNRRSESFSSSFVYLIWFCLSYLFFFYISCAVFRVAFKSDATEWRECAQCT